MLQEIRNFSEWASLSSCGMLCGPEISLAMREVRVCKRTNTKHKGVKLTNKLYIESKYKYYRIDPF